MKKIYLLALTMTLLVVNIAFAADEIHWTVTGNDSVTFDWRGTSAENSIGYGLSSGNYTEVTATTPKPVPVSSTGPFWEAKLTGLTANTRYYYKIGNAPERSFRTPPIPGSSDFTVYAQGNIGSTSTYFNTGEVQDIIVNDLPSFVVGLGDLTLGSDNGIATIDQHFNDVMLWSKEAAYMPVWGDKDTITSSQENFNNYKGRFAVPNPQTSPGSPLAGGEDWYWFDYGNVRFITLPEPWTGAWTDWNTKANALMAQAQADPDIKFIVTFVHSPAYSSGHFTGSSTLKGLLDTLGDTYSKYQLNVSAHSNNYERSFPQHGVTHVTAGTGGADLTQDGACLWLTCTKPSWSAFRAMHLGALKLHFTASGIEGSFICGPAGGGANDVTCTKGSVVDSFVIGSPLISAASGGGSLSGSVTSSATAKDLTTGSVTSSATAADLTTEGNVDWIHWGDANLNRKSGVTAQLSSYTIVGGGTVKKYSNDPRPLSWTDGAPTATSTNNKNGVYVAGQGNGFSFTVPADTSTRTLSVHIGGLNSGGTLVAHLSDGSTADFMDVTAAAAGQYDRNYVIPYQAASAGQTLTVSWKMSSGAGNVTLNGAALTSGDTAGTPAVTATTTTPTSGYHAPAPTSALVVNVKDKGATANDSTDDTAAIQAAVDQVGGTGGTVLVPAGTYMINAAVSVKLKSNITLEMESGAILKAIPNNLSYYEIIKIAYASNVNVVGGTIWGERHQHLGPGDFISGTGGESGMCISIRGGSNVYVEGVIVRECWGDGIYAAGGATNVNIYSVVADDNRRQGMSIVKVNGMVARDSIFKNTKGHNPQAGIMIEPNAGDTVNNVLITNNQILNNYRAGIVTYTGAAPASNIIIENNISSGNNGQIWLSQPQSGNIVRNNTLIGNKGIVFENASGNTATGNTIKYTASCITQIDGASGNNISNNTCTL